MDCHEARRWLDQGLAPGSSSTMRAELGFHLAACTACSAYRRDPHAQLLAELLAEAPVERPVEAPARRWPAARPPQAVRYALLALLIVGLLAGVYIIGSATLALATIQRNLSAMQQLPTAVRLSAADRLRAAEEPGPLPTVTLTPGQSSMVVASAELAADPTDSVPATVSASPAEARASAATVTPWPTTAGSAPQPTARLAPPPALDPANIPVQAPPAGRAINVLLLGIDRRPEETYPSRADAIMVAHIDPQRQRIALLSLPRDLIVQIPGYGQGRINAAAVYGELNPQLGGGVELTRATVSNLLDIPIDYVVHLNFQGFIAGIDAIGGITVEVEKELYDPAYPTMNYGYMEVYFAPGTEKMDGERALVYSRIRHMDSDFERMRRQQQVVVAALQRVREQNRLEQLQTVADLTTALRDYIHTDMPEELIVGLAWALRGFAPDSVERYRLDENMVSMYILPGDPYAEFAVPGAIDRLVRQLLEGPAE